MIRVWKHILRPLAEAANVHSILEIGSEFGLSTQVLLNYVHEVGGHLHAIDPHPAFDVAKFESENEGFLTYYVELSLNALHRIPPIDLAMVDGDHNWYTVYHELKLLEARHHADPAKMPLIFAHDTGWPYGRRDLYYDPDTIPDEYRQPFARDGIVLGRSKLVPNRGMNLKMCNAIEEGGARNGVMTAIEDYLAQSSIPWKLLHLPLYFGVTVLVTEEVLAAMPALQSQVSILEKQLEGKALIEAGEELRIAEGIAFQKVHRELQEANRRIQALESELARVRGDGSSA